MGEVIRPAAWAARGGPSEVDQQQSDRAEDTWPYRVWAIRKPWVEVDLHCGDIDAVVAQVTATGNAPWTLSVAGSTISQPRRTFERGDEDEMRWWLNKWVRRTPRERTDA